MTYYRFSNNENPMSNWGHAMFAEDRAHVEHYGEYEYHYHGDHSVNIEDIRDLIIDAWNQTVEGCMEPIGFEEYDAEAIYNEFNPEDIVMSAQAWDCAELIEWFCENVAIANDITAVITNDGAIVLDADLIKRAEE